MYGETINKLCKASEAKSAFCNKSIARYIAASSLAGFYVGLGILLIFTIGAHSQDLPAGVVKTVMGVSFGVALSLVIMAGSELFTGNNLIMSVGVAEKRITLKSCLKIWLLSYIGNYLGAIILSVLYVNSGLLTDPVAAFYMKVASAKTTAPAMELVIRGILCNILVCLAVLCAVKMKEETAKLIMIFWGLFAFITAGFEHSIANMSVLTITWFHEGGSAELTGGIAGNLFFVTLGNFIGGAGLGLLYTYISNKEE